MQTENRVLDDLARLVSGAAGVATGLRGEIALLVRQRLERAMADMNLVTREEFEVVRDMAARARIENEALAARLAALEAGMEKQPQE